MPDLQNTPDTGRRAVSIFAILRKYPRERLFVPPLEWTGRHLSLLQCRFDSSHTSSRQPLSQQEQQRRRKPSPTTSSSDTDASTPGSDTTLSKRDNAVLDLVTVGGMEEREQALLTLLEHSPMGLRYIGRNGYFRIEKTRCLVHGHILGGPHSLPDRAPSPPSVVYIDQLRITSARDQYFMGSLSDRCGTPVRAIRWARQQHATPRDPFHDPYLAALLVAVAQEKKKWSQRYARDELPPQEFKVHVLMTSKLDQSNTHVYTATIPDTFLQRLADTKAALRSPAGFDIVCTTVPYLPIQTFRSRLLGVLFPRGRKRPHDEIE